jgi:hypothetical protein
VTVAASGCRHRHLLSEPARVLWVVVCGGRAG